MQVDQGRSMYTKADQSRYQFCKYRSIQVYKYPKCTSIPSIQVSKYPSIQVSKYPKYANVQVSKYPKYASMQVCKYARMQVCKYASIQVCNAPQCRTPGQSQIRGGSAPYHKDWFSFRGYQNIRTWALLHSSMRQIYKIISIWSNYQIKSEWKNNSLTVNLPLFI